MNTAQPEPIAPLWIRPKVWKQLTGMSHTETYNQLERGELRSVRVGRSIFIPYSEALAFFERAQQDAA